jgi:phosphopantetheinyl transferase (holo-ACP synthase)
VKGARVEILNIEEQLRQERSILELGKAGMGVFLSRMVEASESMVKEYDCCNFATKEGLVKAIRIQVYRDIVMKEIPRMMENIMNVDRDTNKFKFWKWLSKFR